MTIDVAQFCATEKSRSYLSKPFDFGGYTWATNGHILVRAGGQDGAADFAIPSGPDAFERLTASLGGDDANFAKPVESSSALQIESGAA